MSSDRTSEGDTRAVEVETTVPAEPEVVWQALTEAEELVRWFPLEAEVEPGAEGSVFLSWGPGCEGRAPISVWEPPHRFGWTEEAGEGAALAVDFHLRPDEGGTTVRLVQSGFGADADWDDYYDAVKDGWTYFMYNLGHYLRHHAGTPRDLVWSRTRAGRPRADVWKELVGTGTAVENEARESAGDASLVHLPAGTTTPGDTARANLGDEDVVEGSVVYGRRDHCLAVRLPGLNEALLFVELEAGGPNWHLGIWLSTWGLEEERVEGLWEVVRERVGQVVA